MSFLNKWKTGSAVSIFAPSGLLVGHKSHLGTGATSHENYAISYNRTRDINMY